MTFYMKHIGCHIVQSQVKDLPKRCYKEQPSGTREAFYIETVLRIHLILIRTRILDPHWKKWIQIQSLIRIQVTDLLIFNRRRFFVIFSFLCNNSKNHSEIKTFFQQFRSSFESRRYFFLQFLVNILPCILIQEGKMLRIQRIRILSTDFNKLPF